MVYAVHGRDKKIKPLRQATADDMAYLTRTVPGFAESKNPEKVFATGKKMESSKGGKGAEAEKEEEEKKKKEEKAQKKNEIEGLWLIIVIFLLLIGLFIFAAVNDRKRRKHK
jgi:hypothetical protein